MSICLTGAVSTLFAISVGSTESTSLRTSVFVSPAILTTTIDGPLPPGCPTPDSSNGITGVFHGPICVMPPPNTMTLTPATTITTVTPVVQALLYTTTVPISTSFTTTCTDTSTTDPVIAPPGWSATGSVSPSSASSAMFAPSPSTHAHSTVFALSPSISASSAVLALSPSTSPSVIGSTSTTAATVIPAPSIASDSHDSHKSKTLLGGIVGGAVGGAGAVLALVLIFWHIRRRRRGNRPHEHDVARCGSGPYPSLSRKSHLEKADTWDCDDAARPPLEGDGGGYSQGDLASSSAAMLPPPLNTLSARRRTRTSSEYNLGAYAMPPPLQYGGSRSSLGQQQEQGQQGYTSGGVDYYGRAASAVVGSQQQAEHRQRLPPSEPVRKFANRDSLPSSSVAATTQLTWPADVKDPVAYLSAVRGLEFLASPAAVVSSSTSGSSMTPRSESEVGSSSTGLVRDASAPVLQHLQHLHQDAKRIRMPQPEVWQPVQLVQMPPAQAQIPLEQHQ